MQASTGNSLQAKVAETLLRWSMRPIMHPKMPARVQRLATDLMRFHPRPRHVKTETFADLGFSGERHLPRSVRSTRWVVLYLHGGGYIMGSPASHRNVAARMAAECALPVYVPSYRLAPEHRYPAQLEDAERAFLALMAAGYRAEHIVVAGDSAGGNLALALAQQLRETEVGMPGALVLISPWADATLSQLPDHDNDALLPKQWSRGIRPGFVGDDLLADPKVSPLLADFQGFPPTLIQSASGELLANDAARLSKAMQDAGIPVQWQEFPGLWHDFQLIAGSVPEATRALREVGGFVAALLDA